VTSADILEKSKMIKSYFLYARHTSYKQTVSVLDNKTEQVIKQHFNNQYVPDYLYV